MASYSKQYPLSGSTLTINYPEGLFSEIIDDPRSIYEYSSDYINTYDSYWQENPRLLYPDLILVPANGSKILQVTSVKQRDNAIYYSRKDENSEWKLSKTIIGDWSNSSYSGEARNPWFNKYKGITLKDKRFSGARILEIDEGMEDYEVGAKTAEFHNPDSRYVSSCITSRETIITFDGEVNFFDSNADFYFCMINNGFSDPNSYDDRNGTMYCGSYFGENHKKPVGGVCIHGNNTGVLELNQFNLMSRWSPILDTGGLDISDCHSCDMIWESTDNDTLDYRVNYLDTKCDGFLFDRQLSDFWGNNKKINQEYDEEMTYIISTGEALIDESKLTYRNSYVEFIYDAIVAISRGRTHQGRTYWYFTSTSKDDPTPILIDHPLKYDEDANKNRTYNEIHFDVKPWNDYKWKKDVGKDIDTIWYFNRLMKYERYATKCGDFFLGINYPGYVFTTLTSFRKRGQELNYATDKLAFEFSGYFTTYDKESGKQEIIAPWKASLDNNDENSVGIPLYAYGSVLYPVFKTIQCTYVKLNADRGADTEDVLGNDTKYNKAIIANIKKKYGNENGKDYIYNNVDDWTTTTLVDELALLKESKSKLKILQVNCHGGKYNNTDRSYAHLSNQRGTDFTFDHLQYLLKDRPQDEYWIIDLEPCFAGGLIEDYIHNNVWENNYTNIDPSSSLGTNYLIQCADCSNSPAWGRSHGNRFGQLFNPNILTSYEIQASRINQTVSECRRKNIDLLKTFLVKHYEFMKDWLFTLYSTKDWTEERYQKCMNHADNMLIAFSKLDKSQHKDHCQRYPLCFLFNMLMNLYFKDCLRVHYRPLTLKEFLSSKNYLNKLTHEFLWQASKVGFNLFNHGYYIFIMDDYKKMMNSLKFSSNAKSVLKKYVSFFYDIYLCVNQMAKNADNIRNLIFTDVDRWMFVAYLLDDKPCVRISGSEFGECSFPEFPGYVDLKLIDDPANKMIYSNPPTIVEDSEKT